MVKTNKNDVGEGKVCAILAWFFPIGLIWFLVDDKMRKNNFAKFHVQQSLALAIVSIILGIIGIIPILGWFIAIVGNIIVFVLWIIGLIRAISGDEKILPIIGKFGEKFKF